MVNIVFLDAKTVGNVPNFKIFEKFGNFTYHSSTSNTEKFERCKNADIIITNKVIIDKELMDASKNLKLVCIAATGMNNVDLDYATSKNIKVKNVSGYSTDSVAQITAGMILTLVNQVSYYDNYVKSGEYCKSDIFTHFGPEFWELNKKRAGIIGLGNIGKKVAKILEALGMEVVYFSTSGKNNNNAYKRVELNELLFTSDIICIHAPLNETTRNLITIDKLNLMKKTAFIFNLGRGGIVNEADLVKAINNETIAGAGVDVFEKEPIVKTSPFYSLKFPERVVFTPHVAWASIESRMLLINKIAENIRFFLESGN